MATIPSIAMIPSGYKAGKVYSVLPTNGDADLTFTRASEATRIDETGVIETMATGVPRLDYSDGGCPSLLVEPQSTNLVLRSEEFEKFNWAKTNVSVTENTINSPSGTLTADKINPITDGIFCLLQTNSFTTVIEQDYTFSIFAKAGVVGNIIQLASSTDFTLTSYQNFNLSTGTKGSFSFSANGKSSITNIGNGWYRCDITERAIASTGNARFNISIVATETSGRLSGSGVLNTQDIYIWGAQLEALPYATSYIPTVASAVTRVAETASKTGLSSYINSSEGVLFFEGKSIGNNPLSSRVFSLSDSTTNNTISFLYATSGTSIGYVVKSNTNTVVGNFQTVNIFNNIKVAVTWKLNEFKFFINGVKVFEQLSGATPLGLNRFAFDSGSGSSPFFSTKTKNLQIFNQALTDQELQTLTTL